MARINYKVDKELAERGMLRVAVVAKALNVAPKTINVWSTKYKVSKVGGVKYLTWAEVFADNFTTATTFDLPSAASEVYTRVYLTDAEKAPTLTLKPEVVTKTNDALAKAKALLVKKAPQPKVDPYASMAVAELSQFDNDISQSEEILTVQPVEEPNLLTIHPDYQHLLRKTK